MSADRYSGLVTAIAVLAAVIYADGSYDNWDAFLGFIGFVLGLKYIPEATKKGNFFIFLVASLISISIVAMLFFIFEHLPAFRKSMTLISNSSFETFLGCVSISFIVIKCMPESISRKYIRPNNEN